MNRSAEQTNHTRTASRFTRFVCPALRFIPHEPRKKDSHSLIHVILVALRPSSVHRYVGINGLCFLKPLDEASYEFLIEWVVDPSGAK